MKTNTEQQLSEYRSIKLHEALLREEELNSELQSLRAHKARLDRELHEMRRINLQQMNFFQDAAAYIRWVNEHDQGRLSVIAPTLIHDIMGIANDEPCFIPRVTGYSGKQEVK